MYNFQPSVVPTTHWQNWQLEPRSHCQCQWQALPPPMFPHHWQTTGNTMPGMPCQWCKVSTQYFHYGLPFYYAVNPHVAAVYYYPSHWMAHWQHPAQYYGAQAGWYTGNQQGQGFCRAETLYQYNNSHESARTVPEDHSTGTHARRMGVSDETGAYSKVWRTPSQKTH